MNISNELKKIGWFPDRKIEFNNNHIKLPLKIRMFVENFGGLEYFNQNHVCFNFFKNISKTIVDNTVSYTVGAIHSGILGRVILCMSENETFYILEYNRKIAHSIEEFFYRMFSDSLDISLKIFEKFF